MRQVLLPGALLVATALVVVLGMQVRTARAALEDERRRAILPADGQVVPAVRVRTVNGDSLVLGEGPPGTRQVVFVFNTRCGICVATLPGWARVRERLAHEQRVSVLGWSQDADSATRRYVTEHDLRVPVVVGVPVRYLRLYHAMAVPATLVLDEEGTVLVGRPGMLSPAAEDSVVVAARG